jgi:tRNA(Ile)-lysidine synthase
MLERIAAFISRHEMLRPGARVGVAVSGGADSVFLLHAMRELAPPWNLALSVIHIEHGIRGIESKQDAEFARSLAVGFGLPFHLRELSVPDIDDNIEQAARNARHGFYCELLASGQLDRIATGHTGNDQAETVLYRIIRGSGLAGLTGILPVTREGLIRPLLELARDEIEAWLRKRCIAWREDETNQDRSYARNRLRHEILPIVRETLSPRADEALATLAALARDEELYWRSEVSRHLPATTADGPVVLRASLLTELPVALARRVVRQAIEHAKGDLRQIEFSHVERILEMARSEQGHDRVQLPSLDVTRSFEWIRLAASAAQSQQENDFSFALQAPGSVELPKCSTRITLQVLEKTDAAGGCDTVVDELDWQRFHPLDSSAVDFELRNWRPGDQYRRVGQSSEQKLKILFQQARVPLWERRNWPIITYNGVIVWTRRFGAAAEFAASPSTRVVLRVAERSREIPYPSQQL